MIGYPSVLNTKEDYENALAYVKEHKEFGSRFKAQLENLKNNVYKKVLKEGSEEKDPEELTSDDFVDVYDPACEKEKLGITDAEIDKMIKEIK